MKGSKKVYREIPHTADLAIEVWGESLEELFENASLSLGDLVGGKKSSESMAAEVEVEGVDLVDAFIRFLSEVHYLIFAKGLIPEKVKCSIEANKVSAKVTGKKGIPELEIKAVTYHMADIWEENGLWKARVVFDV